MKKLVYLIFAIVPLAAAITVLQSCGGQGGPTAPTGGGTTPVSEAFKALLPAAQQFATVTYVGSDACATCHNDPSNPHFDQWKETAHYANNVTCERCHGPGSTHVAAPGTHDSQADMATANILTMPNVASPTVCAQCHTETYAQYKESKHFEIVASPAKNTGTSRCQECHSAITRVMSYDAVPPVDFDNLTAAQHTMINNQGYPDLATVPHTAACVTCHNPHSVTGNLNADGEERQLRHATANTTDSAMLINPLPIVFQQVNQLCGQCHQARGADSTDTGLRAKTTSPNVHDAPQFNMLLGVTGAEGAATPVARTMAHTAAPGQCSHCHMGGGDHTWSATKFETGCAPCHDIAGAAARWPSTRDDVMNRLLALKQRMSRWAQSQTWGGNPGGVDAWMYSNSIPAGQNKPTNQTDTYVPIEIKRARHNYYFIIRDGSYGVHNHTYVSFLLDEAEIEMDNAGFPKAMVSPTTRSLSSQDKLAIFKADLALVRMADKLELGR